MALLCRLPRRHEIAVSAQTAEPPRRPQSAVLAQTQWPHFDDREARVFQQLHDLTPCEKMHRQGADALVGGHCIIAARAAQQVAEYQAPAVRGPQVEPAI